jgi:hypothetical protein
VRAIECENGFGTVEKSVLNTIMKINRKDNPFILVPHLRRDFAAAINGSRQKNIIRRGTIAKNMREVAARTIAKTSLDLGSKS